VSGVLYVNFEKIRTGDLMTAESKYQVDNLNLSVRNSATTDQPTTSVSLSTSNVENYWEPFARQLAHVDPVVLLIFICLMLGLLGLILALLPSACEELAKLIEAFRGK
jgi:hypothetical protein